MLFLRTSGSLVLKSGNYPFSGGKELTPLPPSEKSSSPSPLATLGPLWGANGEGSDAVEKDLPVTEGSQRVGLPFYWNQGLVVKTCLFLTGRWCPGCWSES